MEVTIEAPVRPFLFIGNALWLDFINTEVMFEGARTDLLSSYSVWVNWLIEAEIIEESQAGGLLKAGAGSTGENALTSIREFRASLRAITFAASEGIPVPDHAVKATNYW